MKRIYIFLISVIIISLGNCSKDEDNGDIELSTDSDTIMTEILTEVSPENETFMDIAPIPIPSELYDYAAIDTNFQAAIQTIEDFNDMIENPGVLLGTSLKSSQTAEWESLGCEETAYSSICMWERNG